MIYNLVVIIIIDVKLHALTNPHSSYACTNLSQVILKWFINGVKLLKTCCASIMFNTLSKSEEWWCLLVVEVVAEAGLTNLFALSSSPPSPHLLGRCSVELELHPSGHQTNQLGRPARSLQPAPGKSNTGLPFPPGCVCARVSVCVSRACALSVLNVCGVFTRGRCTYLRCHYCKKHLKGEFNWCWLLGCKMCQCFVLID